MHAAIAGIDILLRILLFWTTARLNPCHPIFHNAPIKSLSITTNLGQDKTRCLIRSCGERLCRAELESERGPQEAELSVPCFHGLRSLRLVIVQGRRSRRTHCDLKYIGPSMAVLCQHSYISSIFASLYNGVVRTHAAHSHHGCARSGQFLIALHGTLDVALRIALPGGACVWFHCSWRP